jgi:HSP20 family molecular chaperone IbpA
MSSETPGTGRRQENVRLFPSQLVRPRNAAVAPADIRAVDGHLYVTLHVPHIDDSQLRYSIRGRYLLVWGEGGAHEDQRLVMLPQRVVSQEHSVRFQNGVFDARIKIQNPK